jgi:hypothetical protein
MSEQIDLQFLQCGIGLTVGTTQDDKFGNALAVGGDTFRVKETLKALGFQFRHAEQEWLGTYWVAQDSEAVRAATKARFPVASGWNWLPEFGRKGIEL